MNARVMRGALQLYKETWIIATALPKNLKNYKRFEDPELGGNLQARGIPVLIRKLEELVELAEKANKFTLNRRKSPCQQNLRSKLQNQVMFTANVLCLLSVYIRLKWGIKLSSRIFLPLFKKGVQKRELAKLNLITHTISVVHFLNDS